MLRLTQLFAKFCIIIIAISLVKGCWMSRPMRWVDRYVDSNYMHFDIGVQHFRSFIVDESGDRETIDLDRLPSAYQMETQSGVFAKLKDREESTIEFYLYLPSLDRGRYILNDTMFGSPASLAYFRILSSGKTRTYRSSPRAPALVEITEFDTTRRILRSTLR